MMAVYSLEEHYRIERELGDRLRNASSEERASLYASVYDELFRRLPEHPQLTFKRDAAVRAADVAKQLAVLGRFLTPRTSFLEVGAGDCALSLAVAPRVARVVAMDVSANITAGVVTPANFSLRLSAGREMPVEPGSVDVAFSNQLMEHLHPDDALDQLRSIVRSLAPGGVYLCITPNRLSGPHDVSRGFDDEATGFHLKEYTARDLARLFRDVGFSQVRVLVGAKARFASLPTSSVASLEATLESLPHAPRRWLAHRSPCRQLLEIRMVGRR